MAIGLTPYHDMEGELKNIPTEVNEETWQAALAKWEWVIRNPRRGHKLECSFCALFFEPWSSCPSCPIRIKDIGGCIDRGHPWEQWDKCETEEAARAVYAFIEMRHQEWKIRQERSLNGSDTNISTR